MIPTKYLEFTRFIPQLIILHPFTDVTVTSKATGNSSSGISGNSRESRTPKIPGGNSREFLPGNFLNSCGNYGEFIGVLSFFPIFIVDYDISLFNLTHCIMCTTHDRFTAFWAESWMTSLIHLFVFIEFRYTFKYRKITEHRQNFENSDRYTNEDANSNRS